MGAAGVKGEEAQIGSWGARRARDVVSSIVIPRYGSHCDNQAQCHVGTRLIGGTLRKSHKYLTIALYTGN